MIRWNVHHSSHKLQHQISILPTLLHHGSILLKMFYEIIMAVRIELSDVTNALEE